MQKKSLEQAVFEEIARNKKGLYDSFKERLPHVADKTVASLVADMTEGSLKEQTASLLKCMKIAGCLDVMRKRGVWSKAEYQELYEYILTLHQEASPKGMLREDE